MPDESVLVKEWNLKGELSIMEMQYKFSEEGWVYRDSGSTSSCVNYQLIEISCLGSSASKELIMREVHNPKTCLSEQNFEAVLPRSSVAQSVADVDFCFRRQ